MWIVTWRFIAHTRVFDSYTYISVLHRVGVSSCSSAQDEITDACGGDSCFQPRQPLGSSIRVSISASVLAAAAGSSFARDKSAGTYILQAAAAAVRA